MRLQLERALDCDGLGAAIVTADPESVAALRREHPTLPLVVVGIRRRELPAVLDAGADAALYGPLRVSELRARVRALTQRSLEVLSVGPLDVDVRAGVARLDGSVLAIPPRELALLRCLAAEPGRLFTKAHLYRACWNDPTPGSRSLERHLARLRRRLGRHAPMLVTVWGIGYRLDEPA